MSNEAIEYSRAEVLAAEFAEALQLGENPSIDDYVAQNQDCGPELREMLLAVLVMEQLRDQKEPVPPPPTVYGSIEIRRLGDLRIVREIGRGGMGIVYEAVQESLGRTVAVKVLPKHRLDSDKALARFQRESKTAARLHHTNIVPVLGVGTDDGYHYYVMQFIRGVGLDDVIVHLNAETSVDSQSENSTLDLGSVARKLIQGHADASTDSAAPAQDITEDVPGGVGWLTSDRQRRSNPVVITPDDSHRRFDHDYWRSVAWMAHRVASALQYAHDQRILHRDIKPSNLLVDSQGEVSLADFGLAKSIDQAGLSRTGDIVGTLRYMAPEQLTGAADARSDVYSLGVTLYELVTFRAAFDDSQLARTLMRASVSPPARPSQIRPGMPPDLDTIIVKAMAAEPAHRYQSAADLSEDLRRLCEDRPILAKRTSAFEHLWRWSRRNPAIATLCVVAASLLVTVAAVSTTAYYRTNQARQEAIEQRDKADRTAESAFEALDEIFHSLAPMPMVNPDEFVEPSETEIEPAAPPIATKQTAALLDKMLTFYGRIAAAGQSDESYRQRLAEAHHRIGDIRQRLGQVEVAAASYRRSAELYRERMNTDPSPTLVARLAAVHNELGICLQHIRRQRTRLPKNLRRDQGSDGAAEFQAARFLLEPIATANSPPEVRYELAHTYYLLGDKPRDSWPTRRQDQNHEPRMLESELDNTRSRDQRQRERTSDNVRFSGRNSDQELLQEATDVLQKATELLRQLVQEYPESPDYRRLLAMCYMENSKGPSMSASPRGRQLRLDAIELLTALVEKYRENPDYRFALSSAYAIGNVASPKLDRDTVRAYIDRLETAESLISNLRAEHPNVPQYLLAHLKFFRQLATLHRRLDGRGAELPVYRRATQVCRSAQPDSISNMTFESVIEIYDRTADLLLASELGDQQEGLVEALSVLEAGIQAYDLLKIQTGESNHDSRRAKFLARLTDVRERLGQAMKKPESR